MKQERMSLAWIRPVDTDPDVLVDRQSEREDLRFFLDDYLKNKVRQARVLITGERGIGKSILTRRVVLDFAKANPKTVLDLQVDARGLGFRRFLSDLALSLVKGLQARLQPEHKLQRWLDELALFANNQQITRGQVETIGRKYGVRAGVEAGSGLFGKLRAHFSWDETRQLGTTQQTVQNVTDELLHTALTETLDQIEAQTDILVVIFFDDLDQARTSSDPDEAKEKLKHFLDIRPCIGLVHMRSEMLFGDLQREMEETVHLGPLPSSELVRMLEKRADRAIGHTQQRLRNPSNFNAIKALTSVTGNPYVFLRWTSALLRTFDFPPPVDWYTGSNLWRLIRTQAGGHSEERMQQLANVVDRCMTGGDPWCRCDDLRRGRLKTDLGPNDQGLSADAIAHFEKMDVLIRQSKFDPEAPYRMRPVFDLLRPSVAKRLREA